MTTTHEFHDQAMDLAERALLERLRGNAEEAFRLFSQALRLELSALEGLEPSVEPTYSVLHRSAATLALDCNEVRLAEQLATKALAYEPPIEIAEELRDVLERTNFQRHLQLKGIQLHDDELQLSLAGKAVQLGLIAWDEVSGRIDRVGKLLQRLVERQENRPFREGGPPSKTIREGYRLHVSTPRASSFAMTLKIMRADGQQYLPGHVSKTVDEFMDLMELIGRSRVSNEEIQERIPEPPYLRNFLGVARTIAPDGDEISQVGFTLVRGNQQRTVSVTKLRLELPLPSPALAEPGGEQSMEIEGILRFADATGQENRIRIVVDSGRPLSVRVPEGLMDDIVRPMWNHRVSVKALRKGRVIELQDIALMPEH